MNYKLIRRCSGQPMCLCEFVLKNKLAKLLTMGRCTVPRLVTGHYSGLQGVTALL